MTENQEERNEENNKENENFLTIERNELINELVIYKIENKRLNSSLQIIKQQFFNETTELKRLITNEIKQNLTIKEENSELKEEIKKLKENFLEISQENNEITKKLKENKEILNDLKVKYIEKYNYIQILEKKIEEEKKISFKQSLEEIIKNQEITILTLEERIQREENERRLLIQKHLKEIEQIKIEKMNLWIQLQVY